MPYYQTDDLMWITVQLPGAVVWPGTQYAGRIRLTGAKRLTPTFETLSMTAYNN